MNDDNEESATSAANENGPISEETVVIVGDQEPVINVVSESTLDTNEQANTSDATAVSIATTTTHVIADADNVYSKSSDSAKSETKVDVSVSRSSSNGIKRPITDQNEGQTMTQTKKMKSETKHDEVLRYLDEEYTQNCESFLEHLLELFFLRTLSLNMMDYPVWRKKAATTPLIQFLRTNCDDENELQELMKVKTFVESTKTIFGMEAVLQPSSMQLPTSPQTSSVATTSRSPLTLPSSVTVSSNTSTSICTTNSTITPLSADSSKVITTRTPLPSPSIPSRHTTRQHSIASVYDSAIGSQEQIVERAKQEAYVMQRIAELRKEGLWSCKRLPKVQEPLRTKTQWDYLLEEMAWLATDFAQERKWKKATAKKCARMVMKYHQDKQTYAEKAEKEELARLKKIASNISKQIKQFWGDIEKVVEAKQEARLKEKRKRLHDLHLNFIVDRADKYTEKLTQKFNSDANLSGVTETTDIPEEQEEDENTSTTGSEKKVVEDTEFKVDASIDEEDDEETIREQEEKENVTDYKSELQDLEDDANLSYEQLIEKYAGAYASDFEIPSEGSETVDETDEENTEDNSTAENTEVEEEEVSDEEMEDVDIKFLLDPKEPSEKKPLIEVS